MLSRFGAWATGNPIDCSIERELSVLKWKKSREVRYADALKEALFGLKMNLSHETGAEKNGWSGSFFWRSYLDGRKIGVYKPSDQDSISPGSPHPVARLRFHLIPSSNGLLVSQSGKAHITEAGARLVADVFHEAYLAMKEEGMETPFREDDAVVPDTHIVEVNFPSGKTEMGIGSFQLFLQRCKPLTEAFGIDRKTFKGKRGAPSVEHYLPQYQWLKLFHYLIFAQDDHAENTMATLDRAGRIRSLKAIDNGQSFPAQPLEHGFIEKRILSMKPMHGLKHPLAKKPVLPFFREFLRKFSADGYLDKLSERLRAFYQNLAHFPEGRVEDPKITEGRIRLLRERYRVLERLFVQEGRPLTALLNFLAGDGIDVGH